MKAITIGKNHQVSLAQRPDVSVGAETQVKLRVLRVGICGTDREEVSGAPIRPADGYDDLVLGHEMIGRIEEAGSGVTNVRPGDYAVVTVRRGCGKCLPCSMSRFDMCRTGEYRERGIWGLDGFQSEHVVEDAQFIVPVPETLGANGVLSEPLSIVEKAIDELVRVQCARLPDAGASPAWLARRRCLVAGLGPVGLLAALALTLRGATVFGLDAVDESSARPHWLKSIGGSYIDGRSISADQIDDRIGAMDVIVEATGAPKLAFGLIDALDWNGAYVMTGLPAGCQPS